MFAFKYVITLHVVAMARTKNTARSNPFVLTQATLADHIQAIAISTDVQKDPETKETRSNIPTRVDAPQLKNVKTVEHSEVVINCFSLEQNRFFKGTQAFANPTDLASSRCMGKCFTWFCWCQRKKFSL